MSFYKTTKTVLDPKLSISFARWIPYCSVAPIFNCITGSHPTGRRGTERELHEPWEKLPQDAEHNNRTLARVTTKCANMATMLLQRLQQQVARANELSSPPRPARRTVLNAISCSPGYGQSFVVKFTLSHWLSRPCEYVFELRKDGGR